ncbi:MAG: GIY-YIG nuclease family protein [Patescibacteria group bacterium]|nr:GIY-YIG nuclease family protein [Patescibacteria group bacterium]
MYYTYVLLCTDTKENKSKFYTGFTDDLRSRVIDHETKSVETTKKFDKIELVYYESCINETDARKRENQLKTGFGRGYLKRRLKNYLKSLQD